MDPVQSRAELPLHFGKRERQRRAPADQDIIVAISHDVASSRLAGSRLAGLKFAGRKVFGRKSDDFAQPAPHPVTLYRITNLPRYCETDANSAFVITQPRL
jgi:hypothetical protein